MERTINPSVDWINLSGIGRKTTYYFSLESCKEKTCLLLCHNPRILTAKLLDFAAIIKYLISNIHPTQKEK